MRNRILNYPALNTDVASLLLRLIFGGMFIYYGYLKIEGFSQYASMFPDYLGIGHKPTYILVNSCEFIGGILLVLGLFTRLAITPIFIIMVVAFLVAHKNDPFEKKEIVFVYIFLSVVIFVLGSGKFSLDRLLFIKNKSDKNN